jgi:outer membrane immunogenic protein
VSKAEGDMRILLGGLAALTLSAASTMAADLPARMPVKAPVMAPEVYNWAGFYIGGNGGYSWGRSRSDMSFFNSATGAAITPPAGAATSNSFNLNGGVAGGQAGYNWQTSNWVFGLETDLQWSGERGSANFFCPGSGVSLVALTPSVCTPGVVNVPATNGTGVTVDQKIEWFGTFRARAGVLVTPSVLAYATGGLAYGSVKTDMTLTSIGVPGATTNSSSSSSTSTHAGWTVGGGIEAMFGSNWSGKLEYLYVDLGTFSSSVALPLPPVGATISSRVTDNIFRAGINYHFNAGPVVARY